MIMTKVDKLADLIATYIAMTPMVGFLISVGIAIVVSLLVIAVLLKFDKKAKS